ncbi:Serine/threonine-protein kinase PrkC [Stieleria neptunia]|uniref:Serine/threonine-protein kinase PrkC n=1 Tax=Stieleria neptunia TaxID=2527979 RepID=A0A518HXY5_9BACT|nr:serine/threonine protein kinase [Stieleria neptunia]QDV45718.1 Serine/threonine-protein kinase PrkC [Stieleria neptunia]
MPQDNAKRHQETRSQWKTLDGSPRARRGLGQSTIMSVVRQAPVGPLSPVIASLVVAVLLGVTLYVGWLVRESVRGSIRNSLETVLAANINALQLWLADQRETAKLYAAEDGLRGYAIELLEQHSKASEPAGDLAAVHERGPNRSEYLKALTARLSDAGYLGWAIVDPLGGVLDSSDARFNGGTIPLGQDLFARLTAGTVSVTRPFEIEIRRAGEAETPTGRMAVMCAVAPVRDDLRTTGSVVLMIDPAKQFSKILSVAQMGSSGETYAFDRNAVMISSSRFESQLTQAGLLSPGETSPLKIQVRDPGVDIRARNSVPGEPATWPLTWMADHATRGGVGSNVVGYNGYRGVPVVGAWTWLSEYHFGIASELEVEEAFASLRILRNSFLALFGAVSIAAAILLGLVWITRPRDINADRVEELKRRLGQYDLQQRIGRGGMGTVYLGEHGLLDRKVAIKVLENANATERSLARFQREVQLSARLKHPNTVEIYDFGRTDEGTFFYVMEYVEGISLEQLVDYYGRQPAERVIYLLLQICGSIAEAHAAGMIHRDIKPANVLLTSRSGIHDLIKVLDFGLAKQIDHESMQLTRVDSLTGTPLYMSPEAIRDAASADVLSDIYSIGAVGYTLLCGHAPLEGESATDVCAKKLHEEPEPPERRIGVPLAKDLQRVLLRCLHLDPLTRPQSAQQLANELLACADSPHWTQADAALWWREIFDGPYLDDFELSEDNPSAEGTQGDTAVNEKRPAASPLAQSTAS